ncbi:hypothetical protein HZ989_14260 [Brevundimonas sp. AJA228-03]|uniref:hypothetical protein n=1 Tax=Brevundimonas sp. AJA228-03 TaxID=2752515 RepID=UPI001AE083FF|nr:hypothetical protein [Brevundimonas sp. AJA228-03]QTN19361.1 hypothetical protein HZ989_14260 [Brevundimonas sp. AJA228-03]
MRDAYGDPLDHGLAPGIDGRWTNVAIGTGFAMLVIAGLMLLFTYQSAAARRRAMDPRRAEGAQRLRVWTLLIYSLVLVVFSVPSSLEIGRLMIGASPPHDGRALGVVLTYVWLVPLVLMGWDYRSRINRRWLNDELSRNMRAQSLMLAFFVLLAGVTAALALTMVQPAWGLMALPPALGLAVASAALRFAWLDREAGKDG